jgi:exosome complex exonuclease RRP6
LSADPGAEDAKKKSLLSLEKLISRFLDVKIDKSFQLADWRIRPLPKGILSYARTDSHYLLYLYHILLEKLNDNSKGINKLAELSIECNNLLKKRMLNIKYKRIKLLINKKH